MHGARRRIGVGLVATLAMVFGAAARPSYGQQANTIESRLKHLEDLEQLRQLLADYIRNVDAQDYASYSKLFTRDGELIFAQNRPKGPEEIRALMERGARSMDAARAAAFAGSAHLNTDVTIAIDGDRATASSRWTLLAHGSDDRPVVSARGHYNDVLVREDGRWKFRKRVVYADIPHQDPFEAVAEK
jgi:ketosteroid isomerase-like protein